jgi:adenosylhomocysteine nucleosidase
MSKEPARRHVVVLAPMPLEMDAITKAFSLTRSADGKDAPWTGHVGDSEVTAIHIGMGPSLTRLALSRLLDSSSPDHGRVDHVMVAGICGGLDPEVEVGTLINPELVMDHATGATYRHQPPGSAPRAGKLVTTEQATLDHELSKRFFEDGFMAVDMETAAVGEVCEARGCSWSAYRCIGDRYFDGLLDERVLALANPDGSGKPGELERLLAAEPEIAVKLERLGRETSSAARLAAEAAVRGCLDLEA